MFPEKLLNEIFPSCHLELDITSGPPWSFRVTWAPQEIYRKIHLYGNILYFLWPRNVWFSREVSSGRRTLSRCPIFKIFPFIIIRFTDLGCYRFLIFLFSSPSFLLILVTEGSKINRFLVKGTRKKVKESFWKDPGKGKEVGGIQIKITPLCPKTNGKVKKKNFFPP